MIAKVLGTSKYEKDNKVNWTLHVMTEFNSYEQGNGAYGYKAQSIWTNVVDCSTLMPDDLVELNFEPGFQDRATLVSFTVLSKTANNPFTKVNLPEGKLSSEAVAASASSKK